MIIASQPAKAVLYTRVSTDEQADKGTSLAEQLIACGRKAEQTGAQVVAHYEDAGVSGALYESRPGLQAALRDIEAKRADSLIVYNVSRLSRDREHQSLIKRRVETAGGRLVFCDMSFDDTPEGDLAFGIIGTFADYERKSIRKRTMAGRRRRAEEGIQPSRSRSPHGYHIVTKKDVLAGLFPLELLGTYQIVRDQAEAIRHIFYGYADGKSLTVLTRELQALYPVPRGGQYWRRDSLKRIMENPVYKGTPAFGRHQARTDERRALDGRKVSYAVRADESAWVYLRAEPLVDEATWKLCQQRLAEGRQAAGGNPSQVKMLTRLLRCPCCHNAMQGKRVTRTFKTRQTAAHDEYYRCRNSWKSSNAAGIVCNKTNYPAQVLEELTCKAIQSVVRQPALVAASLKAARERAHFGDSEAEIERLRARLHDLEAQEKATVQAQIAGILAGASPEAYAGVFRDLAEQKKAITARLADLERTVQDSRIKDEQTEAALVAQALADVDEALTATEITPMERRNLLAHVVRDIYPKEDEKGNLGVVVNLKSPLLRRASKAAQDAATVAMISTLARGTVTVSPSESLASSTRTWAPEPTRTSCGGRAATVASLPK